MIAILLISFAAICKALSDTLAWHHGWFVAKFPKLNTDFWRINVVSKKVKKIFNFPIDAWHIANSLQIIAWLFLAVVHHPLSWYLFIGAGGVLFVIVFNVFYNKIFR